MHPTLRLIYFAAIAGVAGTAVFASHSGLGLPTERDPKVMELSRNDCPNEMRDYSGRCRRSVRRGYRSGGSGFGK